MLEMTMIGTEYQMRLGGLCIVKTSRCACAILPLEDVPVPKHLIDRQFWRAPFEGLSLIAATPLSCLAFKTDKFGPFHYCFPGWTVFLSQMVVATLVQHTAIATSSNPKRNMHL